MRRRSNLLLIVGICGAAQLSSCHAPHTGPKLIEADAVTYIACGGALWVENDNPGYFTPRTSAVLFQDAEGKNHELKRVRMLRIRDLPSNSAVCKSSAVKSNGDSGTPQWLPRNDKSTK
jgi:hypothetical protein